MSSFTKCSKWKALHTLSYACELFFILSIFSTCIFLYHLHNFCTTHNELFSYLLKSNRLVKRFFHSTLQSIDFGNKVQKQRKVLFSKQLILLYICLFCGANVVRITLNFSLYFLNLKSIFQNKCNRKVHVKATF